METANLLPRNEGPFVQGPTVAVSMGDLITMMSKEVALKVAEELRDKEIIPLTTRMSAIELKMATPDPEVRKHEAMLARARGAFDGIWKLIAVAALLLEMYRNFHH